MEPSPLIGRRSALPPTVAAPGMPACPRYDLGLPWLEKPSSKRRSFDACSDALVEVTR